MNEMTAVPQLPGPEESKLRNRLRFYLTRCWPDVVVRERLGIMDEIASCDARPPWFRFDDR